MRPFTCKAFRLESRIADSQGSEVFHVAAGRAGLSHEVQIETPNAYPRDYTVDCSIPIGSNVALYTRTGQPQTTPVLLGVAKDSPGIASEPTTIGNVAGQVRFTVTRVEYSDGWGTPYNHKLAVAVNLIVQ